MKRFLSYLPVVLGVLLVSVAIFVTGGFSIAESSKWVEEAPPPSSQLTSATSPSTESSKATSSPSSRTYLSRASQTSTSATSEETTKTTSTSTSPSSETTAKKTVPVLTGPKGKYSSIRVFLDLQRIIFYKVDPATGQEYEAYAVRCSTGTRQYPTPTTGPNKPFKLTGKKARLTIFISSKSTVKCWVRYATHIRGSYWFHSVPYDYLVDGRGNARFDPSRCYMYSGYDVLGSKTSSHGCIRMALRDANFLYSNSYSGMPCYIISSYSATYPGQKPLAPAPLPPALKGPRNWDPTDPDWPGYQTPSQPVPVEPPTTVTEPPQTETSLTAPEATTVAETSPTTEENPEVTTTLPPDSNPDPGPEEPPEPEAGN